MPESAFPTEDNLPDDWIVREGATRLDEAITLIDTAKLLFDGQTDHPVCKPLPVETIRAALKLPNPLEELKECIDIMQGNAAAIRQMADDPLNCACEPEIWSKIDLMVAKKRLEFPGLVLELLVTGGIRPGKSFGCARRSVAHWMFTEGANVFGLSETETTSRTLQQQPVERFLPESISPKSGKKETSKHERFKFMAGHFTGEEFKTTEQVEDESGREFTGGGAFAFRTFGQPVSSYQGFELTGAWSDELVPLPHVKAIKERMGTRATDTGKPAFLARIRKAVEILEAGKRLPTALLGAIYHSVHMVSFTPKDGWNETVNYFLQGAVKSDFEISPDLVNKPGVKDPRVPRFAHPVDPTKMVAYIFTSDNIMKPAYPAIRAQCLDASEYETRITLHGDVDRDWTTLFSSYDEKKHLKTWADVPRDGTIYELCDPAAKKPRFFDWILVDVAGRLWVIQEWPCPRIQIEGIGSPGMWAIPGQGTNINGDKGPAYKMELNWSHDRYNHLSWKLRQRILNKFRETGAPFMGKIEKRTLTWKDHPDWTLDGEFAMPHECYMDPRFAGAPTESNGLQTTMQIAIAERENPIDWIPWPGVALVIGDAAIQGALTDERLGMPGLMIVDECENARFTLKTYANPENKERTSGVDDACKETRDNIAGALLMDVTFQNPKLKGWRGGGSFGTQGDDDYGDD